ncbi:MAG: hypothetical protein JWL72_4197 [Ilumatobacteraceae bacterium]|nr:hypothetical protein [Ilumatobacteraceae bacterium]
MTEFSRRGLLVGGGLAGIGTLATGRWVEAKGAGAEPATAPLHATKPMVLAVTPGLSYVGLSGYALQSRDGANAVTDVTDLGAGPRPAAAIVNMDVAVPDGAVISEFYISGSAATTVNLRRQQFGVYAHDTIATASTPAGVGLQEVKFSISPPFVHDASKGVLLFRASLSATQAISSLALGFKPSMLSFVPLAAPTRVFDSRADQTPPGPKGALGTSAERDFDATLASSGVPATARAVVGNVTIVDSVASGFLDIRPEARRTTARR